MHQKRQDYEIKKDRLLKKIAAGKKNGQKWSLAKTTSNLFRPRSKKEDDLLIDVTDFNKVIKIDKEKMTAEVEGLMTYESLVEKTLSFGLLPAVVPELKTITVGGALAGCGIESSSFRFGLVHETIKEVDVLLSTGEIVTCNAENAYKDLFFALPNTFGTLGYALRVVLHLIPAKSYVLLQHVRFTQPDNFFSSLKEYCEEGRKNNTYDFIDGVIFEKGELFVTLGKFVDHAPFLSEYTYKNIYYRSIRKKNIDYLTAKDYIWRWDADWFWCSKVFFMQNLPLRTLFGKWMLHSASYTKIMHFFHRRPFLKKSLQWIQGKRESVIQDIAIPIENASLFLDFFLKEIGIKPIWICPTKSPTNSASFDFCPVEKEKLYLDFGFWDAIKSDKAPGFYNKKIEEKAKKLNGFKSLYSTAYYTEEAFWQLYSKEKYTALKQKYDPEGLLRNFYEKCTFRR